jgi:AcrR family transcriptional regulator
VPTRAGVPESVFYDFFPSVDDCYCAAYEQGLVRLSRAIAQAAEREQSRLGRVRAGLVAMLGFFDDEPAWARLLVLETRASTHARRQQLHELLARLLEQGGDTHIPGDSPMPRSALTGELVAGGVFSVIRTSMLEDEGGRFVELAPSLVAFIAVQYGLPAPVRETHVTAVGSARATEVSRAAQLPIRATRRTTLVLRAIAQAPYSNNREVALAAGLNDEGQTSKLLARLERNGVIENVGVGPARGEPNAWLLTPCGRRAVEILSHSFAEHASRPSTHAGGVS